MSNRSSPRIARPVIKGKKKKLDTDISSGGKEKGRCKTEQIKYKEPRVIGIDKKIKAEMNTKEQHRMQFSKGILHIANRILKSVGIINSFYWRLIIHLRWGRPTRQRYRPEKQKGILELVLEAWLIYYTITGI